MLMGKIHPPAFLRWQGYRWANQSPASDTDAHPRTVH